MGTGLYYCVYSERIRGNVLKLREGRFRLDVRKKKFTVRVVKCWNRVLRELVESPSLEVLKSCQDLGLSKMV